MTKAKIKNENESTVEVEHNTDAPSEIEAVPSPEKIGFHTASRPYSAAARAPVS